MSEVVELKFTILGCGSSPGVPRIHGDWGNCDPKNPKNRRLRASLLVQRFGPNGVTNVVIDTGPDFRQQMLSAEVKHIEGILYTHPHADHTHGIDDLRGYVMVQKHKMRVYSDAATFEKLYTSFGYCFETPKGSMYPPILKHQEIKAGEVITIKGEGGPISALPIKQIHGGLHSLGFRFSNFESDTPKPESLQGGLTYSSDVSDFDKTAESYLQNLDTWIVDALMYRQHESHFSLKESLEWIKRVGTKQAILTHMHIPLDYNTVANETPNSVAPAYDGMQITIKL